MEGLRRIAQLSEEEIEQLFHLVWGCDRDAARKARHTIAIHSLRFVMAMATRYRHRALLLEDAFGIGCIGLMEAIDSYHRSKLKWWKHLQCVAIARIRAGGYSGSARGGLYLSSRGKEKLNRLIKIKRALGPNATYDQIAKRAMLKPMDVALIMGAPVSLDDPLRDGRTLGQMIPVGDGGEDGPIEERFGALQDAINGLTAQQRGVVELLYRDGMPPYLVAERLGITKQGVNTARHWALKNLRKKLGVA